MDLHSNHYNHNYGSTYIILGNTIGILLAHLTGIATGVYIASITGMSYKSLQAH
jgi:hypothetical protein